MHRFYITLCSVHLFLILLLPSFMAAQTRTIDSLENLLKVVTGENRAAVLNELAWVYHNVNPEKGLSYAGQAREYYHSVNQLKGEANALLYMGICYNTLNNNEKAIEYYLLSLRIKEKLNDESGVAAIRNNLGNIYKDIRDYPHALESYQQALAVSLKGSNQKVAATAMSNIAIIHKLMGDYPTAIIWNEKALKIREEIRDQRGTSASLNNLAAIYADSAFARRDLSRALGLIQRSIRIKEEIGDRYGLSQSLINLGQICREVGRKKQAIGYLMQALAVSLEIKATANTISCYQALATLMADQGDFQEAYRYSLRFEKLRDSVYTVESSRKIAEMQVKYETAKKDHENLLLKQRSDIQELQIIRQRNLRNYFIILAVLTLMLSAALYSRFLLKKRTNAMLEEKNRQLALLIATRDKFFSIIAHDLKNPFGALLNISGQLKERYSEMDDGQRTKVIALIENSAIMTNHLLENLLEWSLSQTGNMAMEPESFRLSNLAGNCISLLKLNAERKSITLINEVDENIRVFADYNMISTVLRNLLANAVKFMEKPGRVTIHAIEIDGKTTVTIEDEGVGMTTEEVSMLFRIDVNHTRIGRSKEKGTGLGLILCHEFITRNRGEIHVESAPGTGTKVIFTLPSGKLNPIQ